MRKRLPGGSRFLKAAVCLQPLFAPEVTNQQQDDCHSNENDERITVPPAQFRHIKVHAVPTDDERKRQKNGGYDGKELHNAVLQDIHLRLIFPADLCGVFPQHLRFTPKGFHPAGKIPSCIVSEKSPSWA